MNMQATGQPIDAPQLVLPPTERPQPSTVSLGPSPLAAGCSGPAGSFPFWWSRSC